MVFVFRVGDPRFERGLICYWLDKAIVFARQYEMVPSVYSINYKRKKEFREARL